MVAELSVDMTTISTISLSWMYQMNGSSPRIGVDIEIRRSDILMNTVTEETSQAILSSLLPLTTYNITVYVVTLVGRSQPATTDANTLSLSKSY